MSAVVEGLNLKLDKNAFEKCKNTVQQKISEILGQECNPQVPEYIMTIIVEQNMPKEEVVKDLVEFLGEEKAEEFTNWFWDKMGQEKAGKDIIDEYKDEFTSELDASTPTERRPIISSAVNIKQRKPNEREAAGKLLLRASKDADNSMKKRPAVNKFQPKEATEHVDAQQSRKRVVNRNYGEEPSNQKKKEIVIKNRNGEKKVFTRNLEEGEKANSKGDVFSRLGKKAPNEKVLGKRPKVTNEVPAELTAEEKQEAIKLDPSKPHVISLGKANNNIREQNKRRQAETVKEEVPEEEEEEYPEEDEEMEEKQVKKKRCRDWPNCEREDCQFVHPTEQCPKFPACEFGDKCFYIHPNVKCKFGIFCSRPNCNFTHPPPSLAAKMKQQAMMGMMNPYMKPMYPGQMGMGYSAPFFKGKKGKNKTWQPEKEEQPEGQATDEQANVEQAELDVAQTEQ